MPVIARSDDTEALDEEFLEYLAEFDDKDDDWSWFDSDDDEAPVTQPKAQETKPTSRPAAETQKP